MSDGLSDYWANHLHLRATDWRSSDLAWPPFYSAPIVPRRDDIRVINPEPPYFWLGREAE